MKGCWDVAYLPYVCQKLLGVQRIHHGRCRRACVRIAGLYEEWRLVSRSARSLSKALRPCYQPMRHFRGQSDASPRAGQSSGFAAGFKGTEAVRHMVVRIQVVARVGACRPAAFLLLSASGGDARSTLIALGFLRHGLRPSLALYAIICVCQHRFFDCARTRRHSVGSVASVPCSR